MQFFIILVPIFCVFLIGFISQKFLHLDIPNLSKLSIYVLSPFLTFYTFYSHPLSVDYLYYIYFTVSLLCILILMVYLWSFIFKYSLSEKCSLVLGSAFMNAGNYGAPVILVFLNEKCFNIAIIIMVLQQLLMTTVGMFFAVRGSENLQKTSIKQSLIKVLTMPTTYGAILGIVFQLLQFSIPSNILNVIKMVGSATIPVTMIVLGMQLSMLKIQHLELQKLSFALTNKIILAPLIAMCLISFLPLSVEFKQTLIILSAMPSAANTTLLAVRFNTKPNFVSSSTFVSTILSLIYLPIVIGLTMQYIH